jgi:hypothetical protein
MTWWLKEKYNLIGKRFGKLVVIEKVSLFGRSRWKLQCDCGGFTEASSNNLKRGKHKSCGCIFNTLEHKNKIRKKPYEWLYNTLVSSCISRGHSLTLTYEEFLEFTKIDKCHYCNKEVKWEPFSFNNGTKSRAYNLDRKDTLVGYNTRNCVVCCLSCNRTKGDRFTYEQFLKIAEVIKSFG